MKNIATIFIFFTVVFIIGSCKKKKTTTDPDNTAPQCNLVTINSTINTATTWTKDNVYLIEDADVAVDATLTIEAGTIIKFKPNATLRTSNASIQAVGTASEPIIFTAYTDDNFCGDSNGDATATFATKGFWGGLKLQAASTSNLTYCKFLYAGANTSNGANLDAAIYITSYSDGSTIDHCTFAHTSGGTNQAYAALKFGTNITSVILTNNIFYDNVAPITFQTPNSAGLAGTSNIFHNPDNVAEKNVQQAIIIKANQTFTANTDLHVTELPYVFYYSSILTISNGVKVDLANNVILKFEAGMEVDMNSAGTTGFMQGTGVLFTSIKDDTGGDSNGDGTATSPAANDWDGIYDVNIAGTDKWEHWTNVIYDAH